MDRGKILSDDLFQHNSLFVPIKKNTFVVKTEQKKYMEPLLQTSIDPSTRSN